jgi:hypothetical protein
MKIQPSVVTRPMVPEPNRGLKGAGTPFFGAGQWCWFVDLVVDFAGVGFATYVTL